MKFPITLTAGLLLLAVGHSALGQESARPARKSGAALLKTDIMGVFAHPDDETGMAATLAFYGHGRGAVLANVYCTRGEGGGNMVGTQWGPSLGVLREAELRDCLGALGVRYCYFLDRLDWAYTESASATLEKWGHEETLERLVRLVRALRPEAMVTMNPAPTPGQHGHHQVAGILATEAFSAAADPARFPLQISREGLSIWQPKRLFYGGANSNQLSAVIVVSEPLADGRIPAKIAGQALAQHQSQAFGNFSDSPWLRRPQRFLLVKAFGSADGLAGDLLGGLSIQGDSSHPLEFPASPAAPVLFRFLPRPAVEHYESWLARENIRHVSAQFQPDIPVVTGEAVNIWIETQSNGVAEAEGELTWRAPPGWRIEPERQKVRVGPQRVKTRIALTIPGDALADEELSAELALAAGLPVQARTRVHPLPRAKVVRTDSQPALDGTLAGWRNSTAIEISPAQLVEGKVADAADSSASFRLAHDGQRLFIDVIVRDNVVVTNIAPNDIRGHWRSDSIEICLDPAVGAEHTMGCYKLGIFPWDSAGKVRAARDADANQGSAEETAPRTRIASFPAAGGYRIQAAIPFDEIGLKPGQTRLGFNLIIYDGDKAGAAPGENINKSRIAWAPRPGVQGRPEDWGRIDLE